MRTRRSENTSEGKEDASGETQVPKSKLENGSTSDSDLGPPPSDYKLRPLSRKRTNQETQSPAVKSTEKKSKTDAGSSSLGRSSTRLWSDEDEVTLLKGIIKYNKSTGPSFNADLSAFYRFMEGRLGIDVTKDQLAAKTRRLKAKFLDALKKRGNGKDPEFSKPHDVKMFKLSKKIWGGSVDNVMDGENIFVPKNGKSLEKGENSKKRHADEKEKDDGRSVKMNTDSGKIVEVVLDEKKDSGKIVKKGENSKKQHAVEVELDEKEQDHGRCVKKKKDSGKIVEVVLDEKKDTDKIVKKGEKSKKRHAVEVELDEKEKDNGRSFEKKDSAKVVDVVLDEKKDCGKIVEVVLDEKKDTGKIIKKGENSKKQSLEVELDEKEKNNGAKKKKDSGKIVEVVLDKKKQSLEVELDEKEKDNGAKKKKDSDEIVKKGKTVKKHVREVDVDEKKKDEGENYANEEEMAEGVDFHSKYPFLSCSIGNLMSPVPSTILPESVVSSALKSIGLIGEGKAKELDDKCKMLIMEEAELSLEKRALIKEEMGMSFDN